MTKKKLNIDSIANELEGASLFFSKHPTPSPAHIPTVETDNLSVTHFPTETNSPVQSDTLRKVGKPKPKIEKIDSGDTLTPRNHDTTVSRYQDTTVSRIHGVEVELVRKAVKEFGKEAATHRFTEAEKKEIGDLIYTYKNRSVKTSENEITRIAVNFIVEDHRENGENSVLHKILKALNE